MILTVILLKRSRQINFYPHQHGDVGWMTLRNNCSGFKCEALPLIQAILYSRRKGKPHNQRDEKKKNFFAAFFSGVSTHQTHQT
jgi:hypothetical protein